MMCMHIHLGMPLESEQECSSHQLLELRTVDLGTLQYYTLVTTPSEINLLVVLLQSPYFLRSSCTNLKIDYLLTTLK